MTSRDRSGPTTAAVRRVAARATVIALVVIQALSAASGSARGAGSAKATGAAKGGDTTARAAANGPGKVLAQRLRTAGRAEADFHRESPDPMTGKPSRIAGKLALELPDRFSLEVPSTGERIVAVASGGAWVRPDLKQLIRFGPEQAAAARRAWQVLLGEAGAVRAEPLGANRWVLRMADDDPLRVTVTLNADRLPSRVDVDESGQVLTYHLQSWRFQSRRGPRAFTVVTPAGYDTLRLP